MRAVSASVAFAARFVQPLARVAALRAIARKQDHAPASVQAGEGPAGEWWAFFQAFGADSWDCVILEVMARAAKEVVLKMAKRDEKLRQAKFRTWVGEQA
eukprot:7399011-Pyramimonas_sp.AAC.1